MSNQRSNKIVNETSINYIIDKLINQPMIPSVKLLKRSRTDGNYKETNIDTNMNTNTKTNTSGDNKNDNSDTSGDNKRTPTRRIRQ
jgi:hypothetical protein